MHFLIPRIPLMEYMDLAEEAVPMVTDDADNTAGAEVNISKLFRERHRKIECRRERERERNVPASLDSDWALFRMILFRQRKLPQHPLE